MKKTYQKPTITLFEVETENTIAVGSVNLGIEDQPYNPDIEDFINDETTIYGTYNM